MIPTRYRFRNHDRQVGLTGDHRRVHVVEYETEMPPESLAADLLFGVGQVKLELGLQVALVGFALFGIMDIAVGVNLF